MLTVCVVTAMVGGPLIGLLTARRRAHRAELVLGCAALTLTGWLTLLLPATPRPSWQIALAVVALSLGGPASMIGLDLAGSYAPRERVGSATGIANTGGFVGALVVMLAVGVVLDHRSAAPGLADYRVAWSAVLVVWAVDTVGVLITRWQARHLPFT